MKAKSFLFVPGDSERKFAKAAISGAEAIILDLEDAVAPTRKTVARGCVQEMIASDEASAAKLFVRVNSLDSGQTLADLAAVIGPGLHGIMLPKSNGAQDVVRLGHYLDAFEERAGLEGGLLRILVVATETAAAMFNLGSYVPAHPRLAGLTWGGEDLATAIGATGNKDSDGRWAFPYSMARAQCLFAAAAADVCPIETLYADFHDMDGLVADCRIARRDGFTGRIAIHPDQVAAINAGFSPSSEEVAHALRIIEAFATRGEAGTIGIDGRMYDIPHLKAARRTLAAAGDSNTARTFLE